MIIDVSEFQGEIEFKKVADSKEINAVYIRATQGVHTVDSKFAEYHDGFKAVGIPVGAYHFFEFMANPAQQAQHFINTIAGREGDLMPMVDCEAGGLVGHSDLGDKIQWLHTYNQFLLNHMETKNLLIYTALSFWNDEYHGTGSFAGHPLWIAEYNNDKEPTLPNGFTKWTLWQHTDQGHIAGITQNTVDLNRLNGPDLSDIKRV
jgi:lysozyme